MMTMIRKILAVLVGLAVAMLVSVGLGSVATAQEPATGPTTAPVTGTVIGQAGAVAGSFDLQEFVVDGDTMRAVGTFTGTVTDSTGQVTQGTQQLVVPVDLAQSAGSCQILDLVLGPVDLDLLGLQVHLDTVHLNITAQSGPGNLVGNLLCAVAGLLDPGTTGVLGQIASLLNQLLRLLG